MFYPHKIGRSTLVCGRRSAHFPYHILVSVLTNSDSDSDDAACVVIVFLSCIKMSSAVLCCAVV